MAGAKVSPRRSASLLARFRPVLLAVLGLLAASCGGGSPPTAPDDQSGLWGFVGCSQSRGAIDGYHRVGGTRSWPLEIAGNYDGGTVEEWLDFNDPRWSSFQTGLDTYGASQIWYQICIKNLPSSQPRPEDLAGAETVVREIRRRAPAAEIFVSGVCDYVDVECKLTTSDGVIAMQAVADHLVALGLARPGPVLPPLDESTTFDGCHANDPGKRLHGQQLLAFFS